MTYYSFEKYMDDAIRAEHAAENTESDARQLLLEVPGFPSGDLPLDEEARVVARALEAAEIDMDKAVVNPSAMRREDPMTAKAGWDVGVFTPNPQYSSIAINGEAKDRLIINESILLDESGMLYFCWLNIDPHTPRHIPHNSWQSEIAGETYEPGKTLEENEERIRYGLARLVARHELELSE